MKYKNIMALMLMCLLVACGTEEEGVLDTQVEVLDKAKALEQSIQDAADKQRKELEQQTN